MSRSKAHFSPRTGHVVAIGEMSSSNDFIEIDNYEEAIEAINAGKSLRVVDGSLMITESRSAALKQIRAMRDVLLERSDVELMKIEDLEIIGGSTLSDERQKLAVYRQALRNITLQDPFDVIWPSLEGESDDEK